MTDWKYWEILEAVLGLLQATGNQDKLWLSARQYEHVPAQVRGYWADRIDLSPVCPKAGRVWQLVLRGPNYSIERCDAQHSYQMVMVRKAVFKETLQAMAVFAAQSARP